MATWPALPATRVGCVPAGQPTTNAYKWFTIAAEAGDKEDEPVEPLQALLGGVRQ